MTVDLRSPVPYHGAKTGKGAALIWQALGNPDNVVDTTFGGGSVLLLRPQRGKVETANDLNALVTNFFRAVQDDPEAVAHWTDHPVDEIQMHAAHRWLIEQATDEWVERMREDIEFCDHKMAGRWVWGISIWIGGGWCDRAQINNRKHPMLNGHHDGDGSGGYPRPGIGINRGQMPRLNGCDGSGVSYGAGINVGRLPHLAGPSNPGNKGVGYGRGIFSTARGMEIAEYFMLLRERFRATRFTCGDFERVLSPAITTDHGLTGVILDPPYGPGSGRKTKLYKHDDASLSKQKAGPVESVASRCRRWAIANGDNPLLRIVLAGYEGEHDGHMPKNWRCEAWKSHSGYANADRERIWMSPHCLGGHEDLPLFAGGGA